MFNTPGRRRGPGSPSTPEDYLYRRSLSASASRRRKQGQHGPGDPTSSRPLTSTRARSSKKKPQWVTTNHDLSQYKLSKDELLKKKLSTVSKHNTLLRYELQRKFGDQLETGVNDKGEFVIALSTTKKKKNTPEDNPKSPGASQSRPQRLTDGSEEPSPSSRVSPASKQVKKSQSSSKKSNVAKELSFGGSPAVRFTDDKSNSGSQPPQAKEPEAQLESPSHKQRSYASPADVLTPLRKNPEKCLDAIFKAVMRDKARQAGVKPGTKINIETPWSALDADEMIQSHDSIQQREQGNIHNESEIDLTVSDSESATGSARGRVSSQQQSPPQTSSAIHGGVKVSSDLVRLLESGGNSTMSTWEKQRRERHRQQQEHDLEDEKSSAPTHSTKMELEDHQRNLSQPTLSHSQDYGTTESLDESAILGDEENHRAGPFEWDDPKLAQAIRKMEDGFRKFSGEKQVEKHISFAGDSSNSARNQSYQSDVTEGYHHEPDSARQYDGGNTAGNGAGATTEADNYTTSRSDENLQKLREELEREREARKELADKVESFKENITPGGLRDIQGKPDPTADSSILPNSSSRVPLQTLRTVSAPHEDEEVSIYNPDADSNEDDNNREESDANEGENNRELATVSTFYSMDQRIYDPSHYADDNEDVGQRFSSVHSSHEFTQPQEEEPLPAPQPTPQPATHPSASSASSNIEIYRDVQFHSNGRVDDYNARSNADAILQSTNSLSSGRYGSLPTEDSASRFEQLRERIFRLKQQSNAL